MGVSPSISDNEIKIELMELIPISIEVKETANPMINRMVVGLHFRFRCCSIGVLTFLCSAFMTTHLIFRYRFFEEVRTEDETIRTYT